MKGPPRRVKVVRGTGPVSLGWGGRAWARFRRQPRVCGGLTQAVRLQVSGLPVHPVVGGWCQFWDIHLWTQAEARGRWLRFGG